MDLLYTDICPYKSIVTQQSKSNLEDEILYPSKYLPDIVHCWFIGSIMLKHNGIIHPTRVNLKKKELYCRNPGIALKNINYIPEEKRKKLIFDLLDGLYSLHHYGFVHCGLSSDVIYIDTRMWKLQISGLEYCTYYYCLNLKSTITCSPDTKSNMKYDIPFLVPILLWLWNFHPTAKVLDIICQCLDPIYNTRPDIVELGRLLYPDYSPSTFYSAKITERQLEPELEELFFQCVSLHTNVPEVCRRITQQCINMHKVYLNILGNLSLEYIELCIYVSLNLHKIYVNPLTLTSSDEDNTDLLSNTLLTLVASDKNIALISESI